MAAWLTAKHVADDWSELHEQDLREGVKCPQQCRASMRMRPAASRS